MTTVFSTPEDYDRIPDDDEIPETTVFCQTNQSYLDMLPYLRAGEPDEPDFDDDFPF